MTTDENMTKEEWGRMEARDELVNYHEAGHAVVGYVQGYGIDHINTIADMTDDEFHHVTFLPRAINDRHHVMMVLAGVMAENLSKYSTGEHFTGSDTDAKKIENYSITFGPYILMPEVRRQTMELISREDVSRAIHDLALALSTYQDVGEIMPGEVAHNIIENALKDNEQRKAYFKEQIGLECPLYA